MAGRPSRVRQQIVELLAVLGPCYGYDLWKKYVNFYPKLTMRAIFYHLKKGLDTGEFIIDRVEKKSGEYSWGTSVERTYYKLGPQAKPRGDPRLKI